MKHKRNEIYGIMMRPASMNEVDNERIMHGTEVSVTSDFYKSYSHHIGAMQIVAECAKIYITKNWEKVKDWSDLEVVMEDNRNGRKDQDFIEYYNHKETKLMPRGKRSETLDKMYKRIDEGNRARHNPVKTISGIVLDPSDGDFSLTVNGTTHFWISDSTVIIIAEYIEKQLEKQNKTNP